MNNFLKKSFLISMVVLTAMWGFAGVVDVASANVASAGDLIKSTSSPAVYYLDSSLVKHPFHHEREYVTWYPDFSGIKTVPTDEMISYSLGSTVVVRPGSRLIQYVETMGDGTWNVSNTPEVYAVGSAGELHKLTTAADAVALYGSAWESMIVPLPNYLSANYTTNGALTASSLYPTGTLVKMAGSSQVYYIDGSTKRPVTDAGFTGNRFDMDYVLTVSSLSNYGDGTSITAMEPAIANPLSGAGGAIATGTGLTVALSGTTPGSQVAPGSATNVPLMAFNLTASSDGAVSVTQVNIKRLGIGDTNDFSAMYLYDGATRLTNGKTLNSTTHVAQFSGLSLSIPAGTSKTLTVTGDVAALNAGGTSGNVHYFAIESGAVTTSAAINGSFPIMSNTTTIGSSSAGTVVIDENGALSNPVVGQNDASIAQFKLTAGSGEDLMLKRVTLYQAGSINNAYLSDLKLWQGTTQLASVSSITAKSLIVFDLSASPYSLPKNTNKIFKVTADVSGSARNSDTTKIYLEDNADIFATGAIYGFGAAVDSDNDNAADDLGYAGADASCTSESTCSDSTYLVVQGGQITVAMNGPQSANVAKGAKDVVFMNFSIASGVNAEIRSMRVELHNDDGAGSDLDKNTALGDCLNDYIYNLRIVDTGNGESTGSVSCSDMSDIDADDGVYYTFTDYFTLIAGQTRNFAIMADLSTSLGANNYYAVLGRSGATESATQYTLTTTDAVKNTDNNQWVTDIVPTTSSTGNEMTVAAASLGVSLASNATGVTVVQGTNNVNLGEFAFNAGDGSAMTMTSLTLTGYIASTSPTGAGSVPAAAGGCTTGDGDTYCVNMGGEVYSYINNLVSNLRLFDMTADPSMTTNLNSNAVGLSSAAGTATFSNMRWTIPAGSTHVMRVVGDISNAAYANGATGDKHVKLNIAAAANIAVQDQDGSAVTVTDNDGTAFAITDVNGAATTMASSYYLTLTNSGTLNVTAESNPPIANVVAGTTMVPVLNLRFQAASEAFNVNKFEIDQVFSSTTNRAISSVTVTYPNAAGATQTANQALIDGSANFNITANPLYVPANTYKIISVYFNIASINQTNATYTGDMVRAKFDVTDNFEAKSAGSGSNTLTTTSNALDVAGNDMHIHGTLPSFVIDTPTTALAAGPVDLYRFRVDAAEGGTDVGLKKLSFKLSMTDSVDNAATLSLTNFQILEGTSYDNVAALTQANTGTDSYAIYNGWGATSSDATGISGGKLSAATGTVFQQISVGDAGSSTRDVILVFNDDRLISTSKYYILRATAGGVDTGASSNDSVGMYLYDGDTSTAAGAYYLEPTCDGSAVNKAPGRYCLGTSYTAGDTGAYIIWSDNTGINGNGAHADTNSETSNLGATYDGSAVTESSDWFNGYKLKTLNVQKTLN